MEKLELILKAEAENSTTFSEQAWEASQAFWSEREPFFLKPEFIAEACEFVGISAETVDKLISIGKLVYQDETLRELALYLHYCLFHQQDYSLALIRQWPSKIPGLEEASVFYLLLVISGLPQLREFYQKHSIPEDVFRETLTDVKRKMEEHQRDYESVGLGPRIVAWLVNIFRGDLFQLGRLQFKLSYFREQARVFKNHEDNSVIALSEDGVKYRQDGMIDGAGSVYDEKAWTARLEITDDNIIGYPLDSTGRIQKQEVVLPRQQWEQVLEIGTPILEIHIPRGERLLVESCRASYALALDFFPKHFPNFRFKAFTCNSWLLDNQFKEILPASSNIVQFQNQFHLLPIISEEKNILKWIFGNNFTDLALVKPKTTLQKNVLEYLAKGNHLRGGAGFILIEEETKPLPE